MGWFANMDCLRDSHSDSEAMHIYMGFPCRDHMLMAINADAFFTFLDVQMQGKGDIVATYKKHISWFFLGWWILGAGEMEKAFGNDPAASLISRAFLASKSRRMKRRAILIVRARVGLGYVVSDEPGRFEWVEFEQIDQIERRACSEK